MERRGLFIIRREEGSKSTIPKRAVSFSPLAWSFFPGYEITGEPRDV